MAFNCSPIGVDAYLFVDWTAAQTQSWRVQANHGTVEPELLLTKN